MKLINLDQRVIVPVVDESRGGIRYEMEMSVGELLGKTLEDFKPEIVEAVPVVHGRWVSKSEEGRYGPTYCSICDFELRIDDMPYCPMCGAKMDGDQEART